tara:strand:- start:520 stop:729 length:210 start_codon:yes stop_codon:yes gene_type:complete
MYWYGLFFVFLAVALVVVATHAMRVRARDATLDSEKQYRYSKGKTTAYVFAGFVFFLIIGMFLMSWGWW